VTRDKFRSNFSPENNSPWFLKKTPRRYFWTSDTSLFIFAIKTEDGKYFKTTCRIFFEIIRKVFRILISEWKRGKIFVQKYSYTPSEIVYPYTRTRSRTFYAEYKLSVNVNQFYLTTNFSYRTVNVRKRIARQRIVMTATHHTRTG